MGAVYDDVTAKPWRAAMLRALSQETVMRLHLPLMVEQFQALIKRCCPAVLPRHALLKSTQSFHRFGCQMVNCCCAKHSVHCDGLIQRPACCSIHAGHVYVGRQVTHRILGVS